MSRWTALRALMWIPLAAMVGVTQRSAARGRGFDPLDHESHANYTASPRIAIALWGYCAKRGCRGFIGWACLGSGLSSSTKS